MNIKATPNNSSKAKAIDDITNMVTSKSLRMFPTVQGCATGRLGIGWSRLYAGKTPNLQPTHAVHQRDKLEEDIHKVAEEQGKRRKEVEEKVDSHLNNSEKVVPQSPESLSSS